MAYKIVGVSGSPVKDGNVDAFLREIMEIASQEGLETENINLAQIDIKHCIHCNFCLAKQKAGKYCSLADDAQSVFQNWRLPISLCWQVPFISCAPAE